MTFYNQVINRLTGIRDNTSGISNIANQSFILDDLTHETHTWPDVGHRCRLYTFGNTTQFCNWTQVNSTGLNWSSLSWITRTDIGNGTTYITGYQVEDMSTSEKVYLLEFSYGASNSIITRHRFMNKSSFRGIGGTVSQDRVRSLPTTANTTLYYRAVCENSSSYIDLGLRFHY